MTQPAPSTQEKPQQEKLVSTGAIFALQFAVILTLVALLYANRGGHMPSQAESRDKQAIMMREMMSLLDRREMRISLPNGLAKTGSAFYSRSVERHSLPPEGVAYLTYKIERGGWTRVTLKSSPFKWGEPMPDDLFYCRDGMLLSLTSTSGDWVGVMFQYDQRTMAQLCKDAGAPKS